MDKSIHAGFSSFFRSQLAESDLIVARIAAEHRGGYEVWSDQGNGIARLAGRLARELEQEQFPGVGDWVTLRSPPGPGQSGVIDRVLERQTLFMRGAPGRETRGQVIAANVDLVFIVCGLDGDYNVRRIERYMARIWASGAQPIVVLNKTDLCDDVEARVLEVECACAGAPVLAVSALQKQGMEGILAHIGEGITGAFVGSSGAGKSTLINALLGEERMATQEVRADDSRGRHTTTHRQLIRLPDGSLVIDTPGMRELQLFDDEGIDSAFSDILEFAAGCRFRDCSHASEPGCAVIEAVEAGELAEERLDHYLKLDAEARSYETRRDERSRREADRTWGKEANQLLKSYRLLKGGK